MLGSSARPRGNTPFTNAEPRIAAMALTGLAGREKDVARGEIERVANKGVGVSKEGQEIFDALART